MDSTADAFNLSTTVSNNTHKCRKLIQRLDRLQSIEQNSYLSVMIDDLFLQILVQTEKCGMMGEFHSTVLKFNAYRFSGSNVSMGKVMRNSYVFVVTNAGVLQKADAAFNLGLWMLEVDTDTQQSISLLLQSLECIKHT